MTKAYALYFNQYPEIDAQDMSLKQLQDTPKILLEGVWATKEEAQACLDEWQKDTAECIESGFDPFDYDDCEYVIKEVDLETFNVPMECNFLHK